MDMGSEHLADYLYGCILPDGKSLRHKAFICFFPRIVIRLRNIRYKPFYFGEYFSRTVLYFIKPGIVVNQVRSPAGHISVCHSIPAAMYMSGAPYILRRRMEIPMADTDDIFSYKQYIHRHF